MLCCYPVRLTAWDNTHANTLQLYWCYTLAARKCFLAYRLQKGTEVSGVFSYEYREQNPVYY